MEDLFTLSGRFKDPDGKPITRLVVVVLDEDAIGDDDMLWIGAADAEGGFRTTFARSEFQQDSLEFEETPDLKVIALAIVDGAPKPVFAREFPGLVWADGRADLGDMVIEGFDPANPVLLDIEIPDGNRLVSRLELTDEMVRACFDEILPLVERYTGWTGLGDGLKLSIVDSVAPIVLREIFKEKGVQQESFEAACFQALVDHGAGYSAVAGLYDPPSDSIVLNRPLMEQNGLEFLKIILAHELVHAGQFRNTPGLAAYAMDYNRRSLGLVAADPSGPSLKERRQYMLELEGHATYIEKDFIRKNHYRTAIADCHSSVADTIALVVAWVASQGLGYELPEAPAEGTMEDKLKQYDEGVALYRSRSTPEQPARWEVTVSSLPGGAAFAPG